jgi:hypothetical protein
VAFNYGYNCGVPAYVAPSSCYGFGTSGPYCGGGPGLGFVPGAFPVTQTPGTSIGAVCSVDGGGCSTVTQPAVQTCSAFGCRVDAVGPPNLPSLPSWFA